MLNIIIKAVFYIIGLVADIILAPVMLIVNSIFPTVSFSLNYIFDYIVYGLQYIKFFFKTLYIPPILIQLVLAIFTFHYALFFGIRYYQFIVKMYHKFKP